MVDSPAEVASSWIGPMIGLGFGLQALKMTKQLTNPRPRKQKRIRRRRR